MQTILILESNTPQIVDETRKCKKLTAADHYGAAIKANAPDVHVRIAEPYRTPLSAVDLDGVDGVVFTGAGVTWSTDAAEAAPLRVAGEMVFGAGIPTIGSCNGLQLAAVLLGGAVGPSPKGMEIGLARDISLTPTGRMHPMMQGRRDVFCAPCVHRDEVQRLPEAAILIANNAHSPVQAMVYLANGVDFWGMQYHPELPIAAIADYVQDKDSIFAQGQSMVDDLRAAACDTVAASRLGAMPQDLHDAARTTEIANWLAYIQE